jgi:predicted enzyme related to lactoylglutathione lyase
MSEISGYDHVSVTARDFDQAVRFYEEALAMARLPRREMGWRGAWFKVGDLTLHVVEEGDTLEQTRHIAMRTDDFDGLVKRLQERGATFAEGPDQYPSGKRYVKLLDPEGNIVEIFSQA